MADEPLRLSDLNDRLALDIRATAEALSLSERTVRTLLSRPSFPYFRVGTKVLVPTRELRDWLTAQIETEAARTKRDVDELLAGIE